MKFKIVLFSLILIFTVVVTKAQPGCREKFSPYNICNTDYAAADFIFVGEVVDLGKIDPDFFIDNKGSFAKTTVEVKKLFKGKPDKGMMELYLDIDIICQGNPPIGSRQIYNVNKTTKNGKTIYYSQYMSRPLTDYSPQALKEVFSGIQAVLQNKKKKSLDGYILEYLTTAREVSEKREESDRYLLSARSFSPQRDILVEAVNEQTKKVYRTMSEADASYKFDNLPNGNYKLQAHPSDGKEGEILNITVDNSLCTRRRNVFVRQKSN